MLVDGTCVELAFEPQRPVKRAPSHGESQAAGVGMQIRTAPWQLSSPVDDECAINRYYPKEVGFRRAEPAAHTGAHRNEALPSGKVYLSGCYRPSPPAAAALSLPASAVAATACTGSASERMSMRQPVRRAASRAFCPSLPIARES